MSHLNNEDVTVILQGHLCADELVAIAQRCVHWRELFLRSEVIFVVSSIDDLTVEQEAGQIVAIRPDPNRIVSSPIEAAAAAIMRHCDLVLKAPDALPLPPSRAGSEALNNVNLQIAAARCGIQAATKPYVFRARHDLLIFSKQLLDQWETGKRIGRGADVIFQERVLVSSLFTLNPYSYERLPFHVSDWFNFGLREDLGSMWHVDAMSLGDAMHFLFHPPAEISTFDERKILSRLAPEQHIAFAAIRRARPDLVLDVHNDVRSREAWLDILADNYVVADLQAAGCIMPKYQQDIDNPRRYFQCISAGDWRRLVEEPSGARSAILRQRASEGFHPEERPFPRHYPASLLPTQVGRRTRWEIVATASSGVVAHGPYDVLPAGQYLAVFDAPIVEGDGAIRLDVTSDKGGRMLANCVLRAEEGVWPALAVEFAVSAAYASGCEIVVTTTDLSALVIRALRIERLNELSIDPAENVPPSDMHSVGQATHRMNHLPYLYKHT